MTNKQIVTGTGDNFGFENETLNPFAIAYAEYEKTQSNLETLKIGESYPGELVAKTDRHYIVDMNTKSPVYIVKDSLEKSVLENLEIGSNVDITIKSIVDSKDFMIYGSAHQGLINSVYGFLDSSVINRTPVTGIAMEMNHAGYTVSVIINDQNICLFMPHLLTDMNKLPNPESIIGQEITFHIDSMLRDGQKQYIVNRKSYLSDLARKAMKSIEKGGLYNGYVINVTDYALFVQFNDYLTCMIHKSNLSEVAQELFEQGKISNGTTIEFWVKDIIKGKIFATQIEKASLWDSIQINDELTGNIVAVKDFGLLVQLDYETKGLVHRSNLKRDTTNYKKGESIKVKVTNVNKSNRQITLNLV
jgi:ribosomal protein S1